jgi:hypothetical protein
MPNSLRTLIVGDLSVTPRMPILISAEVPQPGRRRPIKDEKLPQGKTTVNS